MAILRKLCRHMDGCLGAPVGSEHARERSSHRVDLGGRQVRAEEVADNGARA